MEHCTSNNEHHDMGSDIFSFTMFALEWMMYELFINKKY